VGLEGGGVLSEEFLHRILQGMCLLGFYRYCCKTVWALYIVMYLHRDPSIVLLAHRN